jgi:GntR family transcriptional regulator, carbon starvation induced regulator
MSSYTEDVYHAIYEKIIDGKFPPGAKLHIAKLAELFGVGLSPIREALSRLIATNFVKVISQRGFIVAPLSITDLNDIYTTRTHIEKISLTLSIKQADANWEANLLAAFHRLSQIERKTKIDTFEEYKVWEKYHREFNLALIANCGLNHLLMIQEKLYHETERYRRIWFHAGLKKDNVLKFSYKQKAIMEAALAHDVKKATQLLEEHFERAKKMISESWESWGSDSHS